MARDAATYIDRCTTSPVYCCKIQLEGLGEQCFERVNAKGKNIMGDFSTRLTPSLILPACLTLKPYAFKSIWGLAIHGSDISNMFSVLSTGEGRGSVQSMEHGTMEDLHEWSGPNLPVCLCLASKSG